MIGAFPGSFNPPTLAHLAIAHAAHQCGGLERIDFIVSRVALGKEQVEVPTFEDRVTLLLEIAATRPWLGVRISNAQLIADVAEGYDLLVVGADKWLQVIAPEWYAGSGAARDAAIARLPRRVLVVPRAEVRPSGVELLEVEEHHTLASSTLARDGHRHLMAPEAIAFDIRTGAWSEPTRYRAPS
jgi:hypothetical protein